MFEVTTIASNVVSGRRLLSCTLVYTTSCDAVRIHFCSTRVMHSVRFHQVCFVTATTAAEVLQAKHLHSCRQTTSECAPTDAAAASLIVAVVRIRFVISAENISLEQASAET